MVCGTSREALSILPDFQKDLGLVSINQSSIWQMVKLMLISNTTSVVPKPIEVGCPYEDVTLTCSDGVKIKAYVIMARRKPLMVSELRGLSLAERKERAQMEMEAWAQEMSDEKAIEVSQDPYIDDHWP